MKSDLIISVPKTKLREIKEKILQYPIVDRVTSRTARGKHGVTYPDFADISVFVKPFWQLPPTDEFNRQFFEIQDLQYSH